MAARQYPELFKMILEMCKGKIHRARLTHCDLDYEGSLEIDSALLEEAGILPYEKILVVNATNGNRLETYAIPGPAGSKVFRLNGAAAHKGAVGDIVTIMCFALMEPSEARNYKPAVVVLDERNEIISKRIGREEVRNWKRR
jgi:aspartate 1-decarboxylase